MNLARFIAARREQLSLSMRDVAAISGISKATVSDLENGKTANPEVATVLGLARALKTKPEIVFQAAVKSLKERESE